MLFGFVISRSISNILGCLYPAYKSFKALNTPDEGDDTQWLTYWSVYAFIITFECFFEWLIYWIPFYFEAKIVFLLWLIFPVQSAFGGATFAYNVYIKPFLESREKVIDDMIEQFGLGFLNPESKEGKNTIENALDKVGIKIDSAIDNVVKSHTD
ncbi:hypothetical protein ABK040_007131 [Willaertia magna]